MIFGPTFIGFCTYFGPRNNFLNNFYTYPKYPLGLPIHQYLTQDKQEFLRSPDSVNVLKRSKKFCKHIFFTHLRYYSNFNHTVNC